MNLDEKSKFKRVFLSLFERPGDISTFFNHEFSFFHFEFSIYYAIFPHFDVYIGEEYSL